MCEFGIANFLVRGSREGLTHLLQFMSFHTLRFIRIEINLLPSQYLVKFI